MSKVINDEFMCISNVKEKLKYPFKHLKCELNRDEIYTLLAAIAYFNYGKGWSNTVIVNDYKFNFTEATIEYKDTIYKFNRNNFIHDLMLLSIDFLHGKNKCNDKFSSYANSNDVLINFKYNGNFLISMGVTYDNEIISNIFKADSFYKIISEIDDDNFNTIILGIDILGRIRKVFDDKEEENSYFTDSLIDYIEELFGKEIEEI